MRFNSVRERAADTGAHADAATTETEPTSAAGEPVVRVRNLVKHFRRSDGTDVPAIDDVSIDVAPGEFVVLLGPSGCGKTTLLRAIAGLEHPDTGTVQLHSKTVFSSQQGINVPPERRNVSMIFQSYALWPHMSAFDNIAYPLKSRKVPKAEIADRVNHVLELVGIPELVKQYPGQMSGGQQQRVALARAIVSGDNLVLFDEPLSNVDAKVREQLRLELVSMQRELGFAALYVTHDQVEAMELAHRIAVMRTGKIAQLGGPREVYEHPGSRYVATFIGTANEIDARVDEVTAESVKATTEHGPVTAIRGIDSIGAGDNVVLVFRPERCELSIDEPTTSNRWCGTVQAALFVGSHTEHVVRVGAKTFRVWRPDPDLLEEGMSVWVSVQPKHLRAVAAEPGGESVDDSIVDGPAEEPALLEEVTSPERAQSG